MDPFSPEFITSGGNQLIVWTVPSLQRSKVGRHQSDQHLWRRLKPESWRRSEKMCREERWNVLKSPNPVFIISHTRYLRCVCVTTKYHHHQRLQIETKPSKTKTNKMYFHNLSSRGSTRITSSSPRPE